MKKFLFAAVLATASCTAQVPSDQCEVKITMDNLGDTMLAYILDESLQRPEVVDTLYAVEGVYTYNPIIKGTRACVFISPDNGSRVQAYLVPGNRLELTGDANEVFHMGGSALYKELDEATSVGDPFVAKMTALQQEFTDRLRTEGEPHDQLQKEIMSRYDVIMNEMIAANGQYIEKHPSSQGSVLLLSKMSGEEFAKYDAIVTDEAKAGAMALFYNNAKAVYERELERQKAAEALAPGCLAPDFSLPAIDGGELSLSSLRGKYVIIDFWGSWCGWCIKGMPEMKKYYEKYGDRLEILGVDCRDSEERWREAVAQHQLPWKHVRNTEGEGDITVTYAVQGFPTKVLVNPEGTIVRVIVGEDPEFYTLLDEELNKAR